MRRRGRPPYPDLLTPREQEVLSLIREGLTNEQIAARLGISLSGARYHVSEILGKLGVASRAEAAAWREERRVPAFVPPLALRKFARGWERVAVAAIAVAAAAMLALAVGVAVMALKATGSSLAHLNCVSGEEARNTENDDGREEPVWRSFDTIEEAESFLCVRLPRAESSETWQLQGVIATRSHSLRYFEKGSYVAGEDGYKQAGIGYSADGTYGLGIEVFPSDLGQRGGRRWSCDPNLEGQRFEALVEGEVVELLMNPTIEGDWFVIACWEEDGLTYRAGAEYYDRDLDPIAHIKPFLESLRLAPERR